jgi:hypothetical protein
VGGLAGASSSWVAKLRDQMRRLDGIKAQLATDPDDQLSLTDPDARSIRVPPLPDEGTVHAEPVPAHGDQHRGELPAP